MSPCLRIVLPLENASAEAVAKAFEVASEQVVVRPKTAPAPNQPRVFSEL
jgi:hypothetical protein